MKDADYVFFQEDITVSQIEQIEKQALGMTLQSLQCLTKEENPFPGKS